MTALTALTAQREQPPDMGDAGSLAAVSAPPGMWRVLAPALVTWALAALAIAVPGSWRVLVVLGLLYGLVALAAAVVRWRGQPGRRKSHAAWLAYGSILAALLLVTGSRVGVEEAQRSAPVIESAVAASGRVDLLVRLTDFPTLNDDSGETLSGWVPAELQGEKHATPVVLWFQGATLHDSAFGTHDTAGWAMGTLLTVWGTPVELASTSSAAFGLSVDEFAPIEDSSGLARFAAEMRAELRTAASSLPGASLVPGFAVGDTALVSDELDGYMRASSLTHLVAVSGANCALITSAAIWALSWLGAGRRLRTIAASVALVAFVGVVGPDASVQRAAIMGAVLLVSSYGGKRAVALPALGIAISVLLFIDPWQAWHPGFALSVMATGGIVLCTPALTDALRRLANVPAWIALPVAVAAAAQMACGPLLLLLQDGLPASGLIANVIAGPAAPAGTALGLGALVAGLFSGGVARALVLAASVPARWVEETARVAAGLPGARWEWVTGVPGAILLAAVEAAVIVAWMLATGRLTSSGARERQPWLPMRFGPRRLRLVVAVLLGCAAGVFVGPTLVAPTLERAGVPRDWRIVACDVGQGDAVLMRGPDALPGEAMLIDTGDDETLLRDCLNLFGVTQIPLLVLTHDDRDHVGAISAAAPLARTAIISATPSSDTALVSGSDPDRPLLTQLDTLGLPWRIAGAGASGRSAGVDWRLLAPDPLVTPASTNDASLVMRAEAEGLGMLLLADTGDESQARLLTAVRDAGDVTALRADVVKVAHHGSRDQHPSVYDEVAAAVGLVSVGEGNGYGHPARDTLAALNRAGTQALRTDELGSIAVSAELMPDGTVTPRVWAQLGRTVGGDQ